jgi:hypothetical protein
MVSYALTIVVNEILSAWQYMEVFVLRTCCEVSTCREVSSSVHNLAVIDILFDPAYYLEQHSL